MLKIKSTKRALLMSTLAMVLCVSMLIGTTFAWFTDSVTSSNNRIVAGNLDIELYYQNDEETEWTKVNDMTNIFKTETFWEPGHTEVVKLKIVNEGSLALKYQLGVNIVEEVGSINVEGDPFKLSDYIYFGIAEGAQDYANRDVAIQAVKANASLIKEGYSKSSSLEKDAEAYLTMVVYMPATVGNEANYAKNQAVPEINLGVNLYATQVTSEKDSFDNLYDEDAFYTDAIVTSEEELKEALAKAKDGAIIGIQGNVTWTTGAQIGSTPFIDQNTTRTVSAAKYITLLGLGDDATFTATGEGVGAIGIDDGTVIFKNLKLVDESVSYAENNWEYGYLEFRGNTVFENCDVVNAIMMEGESAIFRNCSFNSNKDSEYAVWVSNGNATFENCTFTGARGLKMHEAYGSEVGAVVANNNVFVELSKKPGLAIGTVNADTTVVLTNNAFIGTQAGDQGLYAYETDTDVSTFKFTYENNKVVSDNAGKAGLYKADDGVYYATSTGGLNAGIDAAGDGDTVVLSKDVVYTGSGYANITKDITLDLNGNNISTTSLGVVAKAGTIKNGTITNTVGSRAALRTWSGVSVENVTVVSPKNGGITVASGNNLPSIKNVTIEAATYGIELQYGASVGTIENVTIVAGKNGIVAQAATVGEIKNCTINGEECGVWAQLKGVYDLSLNFTNCSVAGQNYGLYVCDEGASIVPDGVAKLTYDAATTFEGGIQDKEFAFGQSGKLFINGAKVALFISNADELFAFAKKVNEEGNKFSNQVVLLIDDIDLNNAAWTPIGQTGATEFRGIFDGQGYTISNLYVDSSAQTGGHYSSGLFGWAEAGVTIQNVNVDGATIVGHHNVAVIVGYTYSAKISKCHVTNANIVCTHANDDACGDKCGIIGGYVGDEARVTNCSASNCTVKAGRDAGQLIGCGYNVSLNGCSAGNVTVTATGDCTGGNVNETLIGRVMG